MTVKKNLWIKVLLYTAGGFVLSFLFLQGSVIRKIIWGILVSATALCMSEFSAKKGHNLLFSLLGAIAGYFFAELTLKILISSSIINPRTMGGLDYLIKSAMMVIGWTLSYAPTITGKVAPGLLESYKTTSAIPKIVDTSAVIDGRLADIAETGFLEGEIIIPKFVLNEIQALADSRDHIRRSRARRGLDVLEKLKTISEINLKSTDRDFPKANGVDEKLILLAKEIKGAIITTDYNLNRVSRIEGIKVLNVNDLANALKPVFLPGEKLKIAIIREGKEKGQGVGYLPDGTMVVVSNGKKHIGKEIEVEVTSILQTSSGRIIFTDPIDEGE